MQRILLSFVLIFTTIGITFSQPLSEEQIDSLVQKTMATFDVPGMAVAVIKNDTIVIQKGFGVRSVNNQKPVDTKTIFGIASNTKAFTTAAIAQLVDKNKLSWDTKITEIIPELKLDDAYVTRELTIRDILSHRSGLGLGAGDLMVFPGKNSTTLEELIHNLRHFKPVSSFRTEVSYNNLFYILAGEIVTRVSGIPYETYIEKHFFEPLNMERATFDEEKINNDKNRIDGHTLINGKLMTTQKTFTKIGDPAAGIYASIEDMTKWVQARLHYGKYGEELEKSLFSHQQAVEMWNPQANSTPRKGPYNTHYSASGLGWFVADVNGHLQASHTGGLLGIVSQVTLIPEIGLGIIVLTNQESGAAFTAITNSIKDAYFGIQGEDRVEQYREIVYKNEVKNLEIVEEVETEVKKQLKNKNIPLPTTSILGEFTDTWFGDVTIIEQKNTIRFTSKKSPDLSGKMHFYKGTTYVVYWDDPTLNANAFINFELDTEGRVIGFKVSPISPATDFSYNYQDLQFLKK
ncbi:MAG TPA: serine hydrolase [Brumimicrobium sp.]|nr:serine hydrolase [Brumimicrobium sp.]